MREARARRHRVRRVVITLSTAALVVVSAMVLAFEFALPGVGDALLRTSRIVASHDSRITALPLPAKLADATVAVEDEHFYSNVFVNVFDGVGRAAVATIRRSGDPGGSTLAQQLAKQLYGHGSGLGGTLEEIGLGVKLSLTYSNSQILNMYLNVVYYGNGYWGDWAAARGYFGVAPDQLTWAQASLLAGLPQAPSRYDPIRNLRLAKLRQRHVLDRLVANRYLSQDAASAAFAEPLRYTDAGSG